MIGQVPVKWLRCWEKGEKPEVGVTLRNDTPDNADASVSLKLMRDDWNYVGEFSETSAVNAGDSVNVMFDALGLEPGFYQELQYRL